MDSNKLVIKKNYAVHGAHGLCREDRYRACVLWITWWRHARQQVPVTSYTHAADRTMSISWHVFVSLVRRVMSVKPRHDEIQLKTLRKWTGTNSVGIGLKELGAQMSKCLKFCQGLKFKTDFHSKMSVCKHELGWRVEPPNLPGNSNPGYEPTVWP